MILSADSNEYQMLRERKTAKWLAIPEARASTAPDPD